MIHWLSLNVSPFGCLFIPFIRHTALFYALTSRQGSDCKVRTQEAENFDEEDKSLVSAWSCRCEAREETNVLVITYTTVKRDKGRKREEEKKGESQRALLRPFFSLHFSFPFLSCLFATHMTIPSVHFLSLFLPQVLQQQPCNAFRARLCACGERGKGTRREECTRET